ncbi:MAG: PKD domain-containing protein [Salinibacter sp.]
MASTRPTASIERPVLQGTFRHLLPLCLVVLSWSVLAATPAVSQDTTRQESSAQNPRSAGSFYVRAGGGLSDYTGDRDSSGLAALFGSSKFTGGNGFPWTATGEIGYQMTPRLSAGLAVQGGQFPLVDTSGTDLHRTVIQALGRYVLAPPSWTARPYLDAGANLALDGSGVGGGPSIGGGVTAGVGSRTSIYAEVRFNLTFGDAAVDGLSVGTPFDVLSAFPTAGVRVSLDNISLWGGSGGERPSGEGTAPGSEASSGEAAAPRGVVADGPTSVAVGETATFTAAVREEGTQPVNYQWDFGDGSTASGLTASHSYRKPGTYEVTFTARNEAGRASHSTRIVVGQPGSGAQASRGGLQIRSIEGPTEVQVGETATFEANVGGASRPDEHRWRFGDGTSASGLSATHVYQSPGTYEVTFLASGEEGRATKTRTVTVGPTETSPVRISSVNASPVPAAVGEPIRFESAARGTSLVYQWDFGDGTVGSGPAPTHRYDAPGRYTARLQVSGDGGTDSRTITVRIGPGAEDASPAGEAGEHWGIVVALLRSTAEAESRAETYRDRFREVGVPVRVQRTEVSGQTRYRVVVGRFESLGAAQEAFSRHQSKLPFNSWMILSP